MSKKFFAIVLPLLFLGCKENAPPEPPAYVRSIELEALDASCTEVWLKITLTQTTTDSVLLTRDGQTVQTLQLTTADSLLIDEGLLPKRSYLYKAYRLSGASVTDSSQAVQVTTMDTTSHNFTWQIDTLGTHSSVLYDVAIINDTLAYAVGEIYKRDSVGNWDPLPYNAAKWSGRRWELLRVPAYFQGSTWYLPIRCITAFGPDDIWFEAGIHWDGTRYNTVPYTIDYPARINKSWGTSSRDLYVVGDGGLIAHYDGTRWQRIESGTTLPMNDVWGGDNKWLGNDVVLIAAGEKYTASETKILKLTNQKIDSIPWDNQIRTRQSIWFGEKGSLYSCGSGIFRYVNGNWKHFSGFPAIYTNRIRGNGNNDIIVVGDFGIVGCYNGATWKVYNELRLPNGNYESVAIKGNIAIAVGWYGQSSRAVVVVGKR